MAQAYAYNQLNDLIPPLGSQVQPHITFRQDARLRNVDAYPRNVDGELGHG